MSVLHYKTYHYLLVFAIPLRKILLESHHMFSPVLNV